MVSSAILDYYRNLYSGVASSANSSAIVPSTNPTNGTVPNPIASTNPTNGTLPNPIAGNNPITGTADSSNSSSSRVFKKSFNDFLSSARNTGMSYQRTDPSNSNGMDCVTSLWGFMKNYLTPEDFAKLARLKQRAYVNEGTPDQKTRGFAGAVADADLGTSIGTRIGTSNKIDKAYVNSLVQKGDAAVKEALIGSIYTYSGSKGGHVSVISDAWIENGTIKYTIIGAHFKGNSREDGNKSGLGTNKRTYDLNDDAKPGENLTLTQLNSDVVSRAEAANDPRRRNNSGTSTGDIVFKEVKGLLSVA